MALSLLACLLLDSDDCDTSLEDIMFQQYQDRHTPNQMPPDQHPAYANQSQPQQNPGLPIPPPQYQYAASHPNQPTPEQQIPGYQPDIVDKQPMIQYDPHDMVGARPVPNYLYLSIFTTLCCCCCLGIGAIVTSCQANALMYSEPKEAKRKAAIAFKLNIVGVAIGVVIAFTYAVLRLM